MRFAYRRLVVRKAYDLFRTRLISRGRQVMGFIVQTTIVFAILYWQPWIGNVQDQGKLAAAGVISVLVSVALSFLWDLIRAPEIIWRDLSERVEQFEWVVRPKFSVLTERQRLSVTLSQATVQRSINGRRSIISTQSPQNFLALTVRNETATKLTGCEAYLSHFEEIGGEDSVFQSMRLPWVPVADEVRTADIPSSGHRTALVFRVIQNRVAFIHDSIPVHQITMLKDDGHYTGVITLTAQNTADAFVGFELQCSLEHEPYFRILRRGFKDPELIPWVEETYCG
jgi:hypothetical protein